MDVSENNGTPESSILIGFSIINHPFWGTPTFWKHPDGLKSRSISDCHQHCNAIHLDKSMGPCGHSGFLETSVVSKIFTPINWGNDPI